MNLADLYRNAVVTVASYVHVKVTRVEVEQFLEGDRIYVQLRVQPGHPKLDGRRLYSILHPAPQAEYPRYKFRRCFGIHEEDYQQVQGQWVAVRLMPAEYDGTRYSIVQYVDQTPISRQRSRVLARLEVEGELPPWDEGVTSNASAMASENISESGFDKWCPPNLG